VKRIILTKKQVFDISASMKRETMKDKITVTIGEQIRELLTKNGKTAYRMGKDLTLDQGYISRVLSNRVNPSYEFTKRMLNYLGYDIRFVKIKPQKKGGEKTKPKARRSTG
jgi:transcriptional regulator with XRE-family HTH domain